MLLQSGFVIEEELTASLFRSALLKRLFGYRFLSGLEGLLQRPLACLHPGPSVFVRARRFGSADGCDGEDDARRQK